MKHPGACRKRAPFTIVRSYGTPTKTIVTFRRFGHVSLPKKAVVPMHMCTNPQRVEKHFVSPCPYLNLPSGQGKHELPPAVGWNVSGGQNSHPVVISSPPNIDGISQAGHLLHLAGSSLLASLNVPSGQHMHLPFTKPRPAADGPLQVHLPSLTSRTNEFGQRMHLEFPPLLTVRGKGQPTRSLESTKWIQVRG